MNIYNSRNFVLVLNQSEETSGVRIYNSRNFVLVLNFRQHQRYNKIYNSRNFVLVLNTSITVSIYNLQQ